LRLYTFLHIKVWGSQWLQHLFCSLDVGFEEVDAQRILPAKDLQNSAESSLGHVRDMNIPATHLSLYNTQYIL